jgi:hypothetical protein
MLGYEGVGRIGDWGHYRQGRGYANGYAQCKLGIGDTIAKGEATPTATLSASWGLGIGIFIDSPFPDTAEF